KACGYYASRAAVPFCELIFVPYATLMDDEMRKSVGLTIDDKTIVIVDEAHNLFATLTEMSTKSITLTELKTGLEILKKFLLAKSERTKATDFKNLKLFENALEKAKVLLEGPHFVKMENKNFQVFKFMDQLFQTEGLRLIEAIEMAKKANLLSRIQ
uniref:Helicase ATP-binding domain-containing protein n=1 Tax=Panagrolaimus sp. JU765 TaxID=591449 RepID=A0AC34R544_9BILA